MTSQHRVLLAEILTNPKNADALTGTDWSVLINQAHACTLLPRLGQALEIARLRDSIPVGAEHHILGAEIVVRRQFQQALFEIGNITEALRSVNCPTILLKGAAYIALGIPAGEGRYLSDIDIMVPKSAIGEAESSLMLAGWVGTEQDEYNQRYYREWMHEIPPMRHMRRGTVIDLHHTILPPTAKAKINADKLFQSARPVPGIPCLKVLQPVDMVLHSAAHLFHEGEFERGLRDLTDLHRLIVHFEKTESDFWSHLVNRAIEMDLTRSLAYGLRYANHFLRTAVPAEVRATLQREVPGRLWPLLMDQLFLRALAPAHPDGDGPLVPLARFLLYIRGHWLRMPVFLLVPHLVRKAWIKRQRAQETAAK